MLPFHSVEAWGGQCVISCWTLRSELWNLQKAHVARLRVSGAHRPTGPGMAEIQARWFQAEQEG